MTQRHGAAASVYSSFAPPAEDLSRVHVAAAADAPSTEAPFRAVLSLLSELTGTDFTRYRAATVQRRVRNRMISIGVRSFEEYVERLASDVNEPGQLLQRVTIKVSRFYRNRAVFDALGSVVLPELARASAAPLRIWSAGCGFGEEPYTLAMLLEEHGIAGTVDATDLDPQALAAAATGLYAAAAFEELPPPLLERHCTAQSGGYVVRAEIRERVRFSRHDVTALEERAEPPYDLVCCRNLLIYLARDAQDDALSRLRKSVRPGGYLCLGEAEWPGPTVAQTLTPLSRPLRIFRAASSLQLWSYP
jgi:chemotaxis methyl-accepting protein methylase